MPTRPDIDRYVESILATSRSADVEERFEDLQALAAEHPQDRRPLDALTELAAEHDRWHAYERCKRRLLALDPDDSLAWLQLAEAHVLCFEPAAAMECFRTFLRRWPSDPEADGVHDWVRALREDNLGHCLYHEGELGEAAQVTRESLAGSADDSKALALLVLVTLAKGDERGAREFALTLASLSAQGADVLVRQAECFALLGDDGEVLQRARHMQHQSSPRAWQVFHLGAVAAWRLGKQSEAMGLWRRSVALEPANELVEKNLADVAKPPEEREGPWYLGSDEWLPRATAAALRDLDREPAGRDLRRWLEDHSEVQALAPAILDRGDPDTVQLLINLARVTADGELLATVEEFAQGTRGSDRTRLEALSVVREAGTVAAGPVHVLIAGQWEEVEEHEVELHDRPSVNHSPAAEALLAQGLEALSAGQLDIAEERFEELLEIEPGAPDARQNLAAIHGKRDELDRAQGLLEQIVIDSPEYCYARLSLARHHLAKDDAAAAEELLAPLRPRRSFNHHEFTDYLALSILLQIKFERTSRARRLLELLADLAPEHPEIANLRPLLEIRRVGERLSEMANQS